MLSERQLTNIHLGHVRYSQFDLIVNQYDCVTVTIAFLPAGYAYRHIVLLPNCENHISKCTIRLVLALCSPNTRGHVNLLNQGHLTDKSARFGVGARPVAGSCCPWRRIARRRDLTGYGSGLCSRIWRFSSGVGRRRRLLLVSPIKSVEEVMEIFWNDKRDRATGLTWALTTVPTVASTTRGLSHIVGRCDG